MTQQKIQEFNQQLVDNKIDISIIDYVKTINDQYYNIDIDFIDSFISLVDKDECCISHDFLKTLGITQLLGGSSDVKKILHINNGVEGTDYMVDLSIKADHQQQTTYVLHPLIFKKILIRSRNTDKYANYYLLLEMCIKYYNDYYQLKLKKRIEEDNKIKLLLLTESETLDNFTIHKCDKDTLYVRKDQHNKGYITTHHDYETYPYVFINGSTKNVNKMKRVCKIKTENAIIKLRCPSHLNFTKKIKEIMGDKFDRQCTEYEDCENNTRTSVTRFFKLINIDENEFIEKIKEIHSSRGQILA